MYRHGKNELFHDDDVDDDVFKRGALSSNAATSRRNGVKETHSGKCAHCGGGGVCVLVCVSKT